MEKTYSISTPIYYPTAKPHIGHLSSNLYADIQARWHRILGEDVLFSTGLDEHGKKVEETAKKLGKKPQEMVDEISETYKEMNKKLSISNTVFVRTTSSEHEKVVMEMYERIKENGEIKEGNHEGLYCTDCETKYKKSDLIEEKYCPMHKKEVISFKEPALFFNLSGFKEILQMYYLNSPGFVIPETRYNEIKNKPENAEDVAISRLDTKWGYKFPDHKDKTIHVWFDALWNYITAVGGRDSENFKKYWPMDVHVVGQDINAFHSYLWPAMLFAAGIPAPKQVFAHGFWMPKGDGEIKMSKSLDNAMSPVDLAEKYGSDILRFYVSYHVPRNSNSVFDLDQLVEENNKILANKIGNMYNRNATMIQRNFNGVVPETKKIKLSDLRLMHELDNYCDFNDYLSQFDFRKAIEDLLDKYVTVNNYLEANAPWKLLKTGNEGDKERAGTVITMSSEALNNLATKMSIFIPGKAELMKKSVGSNDYSLIFDPENIVGNEISQDAGLIFPKIEK